jgi:hypothetical protein
MGNAPLSVSCKLRFAMSATKRLLLVLALLVTIVSSATAATPKPSESAIAELMALEGISLYFREMNNFPLLPVEDDSSSMINLHIINDIFQLRGNGAFKKFEQAWLHWGNIPINNAPRWKDQFGGRWAAMCAINPGTGMRNWHLDVIAECDNITGGNNWAWIYWSVDGNSICVVCRN